MTRTLLLVCLLAATAAAIKNGLATTPQMGWNSWTSYFCGVTEQNVIDTIDRMAALNLDKFGYKYVNVDDCWADTRDSNGEVQSDPKTFPSGMKHLADYAHSKGFLFGLYSDAGDKTCAGRPGSLNHEAQDAKTYASWGVDYLKYDNCNNQDLPPQPRYQAMSKALLSSGRKILFSMCEWGADIPADWAPKIANSWRTTDDIEDSWYSIMWNAWLNDDGAEAAAPGGWNDPDMLQVGNGHQGNDAYIAHFSLWCVIKAPLIIGTKLADASNETIAILTNTEAIEINQDPLGVQGRLIEHNARYQVWSGPLQGGDFSLCIINIGYAPLKVDINMKKLFKSDSASLRDLWAHAHVGNFTGTFQTPTIGSHAAFLYRVTPY